MGAVGIKPGFGCDACDIVQGFLVGVSKEWRNHLLCGVSHGLSYSSGYFKPVDFRVGICVTTKQTAVKRGCWVMEKEVKNVTSGVLYVLAKAGRDNMSKLKKIF